MSKLQQILEKRRKEQALMGGDWRSIIAEISKEETGKFLTEFEPVITENILKRLDDRLNDEITRMVKDVKRGEKGDKGDKGDKGEKPIAGVDYPFPENGKDGYTPIKGKDYFDGKDGHTPIVGVDFPFPERGEQGIAGKDGSPDTALQIASKLNTKEEIVDMSVVKGLKDQIEGLRHNIRESRKLGSGSGSSGGGGMGQPVHQTFSGNGVLTSFTLSSKVAAGGNAAWIYYNGQFLVKTTHWTISGTTLSLTFTPENGTSIDITFIRT